MKRNSETADRQASVENGIELSAVIAVTNRHLCRRPFLKQVERICLLHPDALMLREKDLKPEEYFSLAEEVHKICIACGVDFIVHGFYETALHLKAGKIHLPLQSLRRLTEEERGNFAAVGCSVHSMAEAREAAQLGASYLAAGHIYETDCKRGLAPRGTDFLREVCGAAGIPVYAIGGIRLNSSQLREVSDCGATGACIMSGFMTL